MLSGLLRWKECGVFESKKKGFCMQIRMDGKLSQAKLSGLKIYYLSLTLRVVFIPNSGSCKPCFV